MTEFTLSYSVRLFRPTYADGRVQYQAGEVVVLDPYPAILLVCQGYGELVATIINKVRQRIPVAAAER